MNLKVYKAFVPRCLMFTWPHYAMCNEGNSLSRQVLTLDSTTVILQELSSVTSIPITHTHTEPHVSAHSADLHLQRTQGWSRRHCTTCTEMKHCSTHWPCLQIKESTSGSVWHFASHNASLGSGFPDKLTIVSHLIMPLWCSLPSAAVKEPWRAGRPAR